jgi:hypothetical protein
VVALLLGVLVLQMSAVRAEDVPRSPVDPPPHPVSLLPDNLGGTGVADDGVTFGVSSCDKYLSYVDHGQRSSRCTSAGVRPKKRCEALSIDPSVTGTHDRLQWRPFINGSACYIPRGETVEVTFTFRVTSTRVGDLRNDSSGYYLDSDNLIRHMGSQYGDYRCDTTMGTLDSLIFNWTAEGGGASTEGSLEVKCN